MTKQPIDRKRALVLGAGVTGVSAARFLRDQGFMVTVADNRNLPPGKAELAKLLPAEQFSFGVSLEAVSLVDVDCLVVSPGLPRSLSLLDRTQNGGIKAVSDIEIFLQQASAPVIAVTGTNGKSTVVVMIEHLLRAAGKRVLSGGNLGPAALDLLAQTIPDFYLLELSSFQLEWLERPALALAMITNITPDHLDRYDSFADYRAAKGKILGGADQVVLNLDDVDSRKLAMTLPATTRVDWFGSGETSTGSALVSLATMSAVSGLLGHHNLINAQAALTVVNALGLEADLPADPWAGFQGLAHRLQPVTRKSDVLWLNDSKATNVGATLAAVEGLSTQSNARLVLILGGEGKGQDFTPLQRLAPELRAVVVMGRDGHRIGDLFEGLTQVLQAADMDEVVAIAAKAAQPGDTVLLSPACASQDQYRDYQERGDRFVSAVMSHYKKAEG